MHFNHNLIYIENTTKFKCTIGTGISDVGLLHQGAVEIGPNFIHF